MAAIGNRSESELINGRYRILYPLQEGGFGKTFLVEDTQLPSQRRCVLKMLKPVQDNPDFYRLIQDRFQREAAIQETLGEACQQIPRLYAHFSEGDRFYLVEEWIDGDTLSAKVAEVGRFSETRVLECLSQLLPIIDIVHQHHIIHRDIKPDNIILRRRDGMPVLIDFGAVKESMASIVDSQAASGRSIVIGTASYMAPEQSIGRPLYASDLYSLGLTAIYLLTGKSPAELNHDPHTGKVEWRSQASRVSAGLAQVIDTATRMHPQDRFASAQEMLQTLQSVQIKVLPEDVPTILSQTSLAGNSSLHPVANPSTPPFTPQAQPHQAPNVPGSIPIPLTPQVQQPSIPQVQPETVASQQKAYLAENPVAAASSPNTNNSDLPQSNDWLKAALIGGGLFIGLLLVKNDLPSMVKVQPSPSTSLVVSSPSPLAFSLPKDFFVLWQADEKYKTGDLKGAVEDYSQALRLNPNSGEAYFGRGDARGDLGDLQGGLEDLNQAIRINPKQLRSYSARGIIRQKLGDLKGANADYQAALKSNISSKDYRDYIGRGIAHSGLKSYKSAIADYNQAISLAPEYTTTYVNRGFTRHELGDKKGAIADFDQAISLAPKLAQPYYYRGSFLYTLRNKKGAIADYNQAISLDSKFAMAYNNRGFTRYELGDKKEALADLGQAIRLDPKLTVAYLNRGIVLKGLGNKKGAIMDFDQAIRLDPKSASAYHWRGFVRNELGDKQGAIADYQKAAALFKSQGDEKNYRIVLKKL
jgi:serine/threonine protein kinase